MKCDKCGKRPDTILQTRATRPGSVRRKPGPATSTNRFPFPAGRQLVTLKDTANYIQKLPKAEQDLEEWQAAVEALLLVVELNGLTMMARIGIMRALNRHVERVFDSSRKDTLWEKTEAFENSI
jgi:hypothetical protein